MYCKTCRQPLPHDARRCPNCGAPVENTVPQSGARDFTADYDPRDIQENRGWGILSYFGFLVLIPIFAARNSYFARFHANQGLVLFLFYACYSVLTRIITNILNLALGFIPFVPGMISAALPWINSKAANARRETMTMVKSSMAMRLAAYFMVFASLPGPRHTICRRSYQAV